MLTTTKSYQYLNPAQGVLSTLCACILKCIFPSLTYCAQFIKLGVFWGILPKSTQLDPNWVFSAENGILKGPTIVLCVGIANGNILKSGRHFHVQNLGENPPPPRVWKGQKYKFPIRPT